MNFPWGWGIHDANLLAPAVVTPLRTLAQRCRRLSPLLAAPAALLLSQGQAKAVLTYNIFESGGNVVVQTNGSLVFTGAGPASRNPLSCGANGIIQSSRGTLCTGSNADLPGYRITGPTTFDGSISVGGQGISGISTFLYGLEQGFYIDSSYVAGTPIVSGATYFGTTLSQLGFTKSSGLYGIWSLNGTSESIQIVLEAPPGVPGPLPLFGAGAAFGWSRKLRRRIVSASSSKSEG